MSTVPGLEDVALFHIKELISWQILPAVFRCRVSGVSN
ncbi:hypothetical protein D1AOALGA4SA_9396 [Olavius algarvensis Delta 1 endosymbiont]|nr:hypothetical protein D1AOALGA4SA_9396 [Olavius algarvensis Delta 1 endosymbiont]